MSMTVKKRIASKHLNETRTFKSSGFKWLFLCFFSASSLWPKQYWTAAEIRNATMKQKFTEVVGMPAGSAHNSKKISPPFWTLPMFTIFIYSAFLQDLFCYHSSLKWLNTSLVRKSFGITTGTGHANDSFTVLPAVTSDGDGNHWNRHCDCKSKKCCLKWWCPPCSSSYLEDLVSE